MIRTNMNVIAWRYYIQWAVVSNGDDIIYNHVCMYVYNVY